MRRFTIALSVTLLLLAGCSNDDEAANPTPESRIVDDASTSTPENQSTSSPDADEDTGDGTDDGGADDRTSEEILDEDGWLEDGRVFIGPAGPEEQVINLAMCDYVVGDADTVGEQLGIDGKLTLDDESGFGYHGSSGARLQCLYGDDDADAVLIAVRDSEFEDDDETAESVEVRTELTGGWFAVVMVNPDWDGEITADESSVAEWLQDMGTRWGGAGV